jgi:UDP-3-O-acyl-N-acetylglucosamine deacetylase
VAWQRTIRNPVGTSGVGIHGGEQVNLTLRPAPAGTGIIFVRKDLGIAIPARAENARDQSYATTLNLRGAKARTVEHMMAALAGVGVTNVFVDLDGAEVPILDGSALPFIEMLRQAGFSDQGLSIPEMQVRKTISVGDRTRWIEMRPAAELSVDYRVSYDSVSSRRSRRSRGRASGAAARCPIASSWTETEFSRAPSASATSSSATRYWIWSAIWRSWSIPCGPTWSPTRRGMRCTWRR